MNRYLKSFGISFLLHATALAFGVWVTLGNAAEEKDLLVVDFSTIALAKDQNGGAATGQKIEEQVTDPPAPATAPPMPESPPPPGPAPEVPPPPPSPEPEPPAPETPPPPPVPESEPPAPVVAQKAVPVKEKPLPTPQAAPPAPRATPPVQTPVSQQQSTRSGAVQGGNAPAAGNTVTSGNTAPGSGPGRGQGSDQGHDRGLTQGYIRANFNYILTRIQRNLDYPSQARRMHLSGIAKFSFIIKLDGHIEELTLTESSGHPLLDEAAFKAIQDAAPFPDPPVVARIIVPISFRLRG